MIKNIILILFFLVAIGISYFSSNHSRKYEEMEKESTLSQEGEKNWVQTNWNCQLLEKEYGVNGVSMQPLIMDQSRVKVIENYYVCHKRVERGDIIIYENRATPGPIIKQIKALPNDRVRFDEKWRLYINDQILMNSVWEEYFFTKTHQKAILMYVIEGKLQETSFLAFGDNVSNSDDSRRLGGLGFEYFRGKVVLE